MPAKGRRVAVRQAELRSRRRRSGPAAAMGGTDIQPAGVATAERASAGSPSQPAASPAAPSPARDAAPAPRRGGPRGRSDLVSAYNFVGAELRRIAIVTAGIVAILVALTFLLK